MKSVTQLSSIGYETADVTIRKGKAGQPDQAIQVRGLSANDLMKLMRVHGPTMVMIFERTIASKIHNDTLLFDNAKAKGIDPSTIEESPIDIVPILMQLVDQFPELIADMVVLVCDDSDTAKAFEIAKRLPIPVQLKLIQEVARLTLEDHGGVGELIETVTSLFGGVNGLMTSLRASASGSMVSNIQSAS